MNKSSILLYRYMGVQAALNTIERRAFRVGRLHDLNDPFEWRMGIGGIVEEGKIFAQSLLNDVVAEMSENAGLLSFSDTAEDAVLWSHYAENHRGVAFEVDYAIEPEHLSKIEYTNERPVFNANWLHGPSAELDGLLKPLILKMIKQKSLGWSYEREYRAFIDLTSCEISDGYYFHRIPDNFLKRVILGFRCPIEPKYLTRALASQGLGEVNVVQAKMDLESYKILC